MEPICYGQVNSGRWCQEWYETASKHAGIRARELRKLGYRVTTSSMGTQVTSVGLVKMSLVDIRPAGSIEDTCSLPFVRIER